MLGGVLLGLVVAAAYLVVKELWSEVADTEPRKVFVREVLTTTGTHLQRLPLLNKFL
jgi:predicted outer membrane lipoprotein